MLAGVGPAPVVMFVVAADEGWMPQSAEHLAALDALGVGDGLLVVTKADLADPAQATADALRRLAGTSLEAVPALAVSGRTGEGMPSLVAALAELAGRTPAPDTAADVRLWVDRSFTVPGAGTVVTGTLAAGTLRTGDDLVVSSTGETVRIRGLQALGESRETVSAVARAAVNLRGVDQAAVARGDALLTPDAWLPTGQLDVRLRRAAKLPRELVAHVGAAAVPVHVRPLGTDTARLSLSSPLPLRVGDRGLLRDPGAHRIAAGFDVLDVRPPSLARRGAARARAAQLQRPAPDPLRGRGFVSVVDARAMGWPGGGRRIGAWLAHEEDRAALAARASTAVTEWLERNPLAPGMPVESVRQTLGLPATEIVAELLNRNDFTVARGLVRRHGDRLPPDVDRAVRQIEDGFAEHPFRAPEADRLRAIGLGKKQLAAAVRLGRLTSLTDGVVLGPHAEERAAQILAALEQPFTVSEARRALDTTRRVAVPLLERMDGSGRTTASPDGRRYTV
jgi:selenocysteine-specific elongation factor